ncbi:MAG TPA: sulfurtransferase TusA family protein [Xanthomonadales bacterium]|nr:sulfurtransferase TusA family protein [Xanthomonadales bacterium]
MVEGFNKASTEINASGLLCPEPLVQCKQALDQLEPGESVHVIATDPHAEIDFEVFARRTSNQLIKKQWLDSAFHVLICKG